MTTEELPGIALPGVRHLAEDDLPWVGVPGIELKVLQVDLAAGVWIVRNRFAPGVQIPTHKHTGPVYGLTFSGAWKYLEYDFVNRAGSFLYEPAHSVHTLKVLDDADGPTVALFVMTGANVDLAPDGSVLGVTDGLSTLQAYYGLCEQAGLPRPDGILV